MDGEKFLYIKVKKQLLDEITNKSPSERIPSRNELMKRFDVTRTTIDRAISELVREGYLYAVDGSGTYVAKREDLNAADIKGNSIGVIIPNIVSYDYPGILRGICDTADLDEFNIIIYNTDHKLDKQKYYISKLINSGVNGIIMVTSVEGVDLDSFRNLELNNVPYVLCNRNIDGLNAPMVSYNNFYGAYIATGHLIKTGCRRIAFLSRPIYSLIKERIIGYISALSENHIQVEYDLIYAEEYNPEDVYGINGSRALFSLDPKIDAILCSNDKVAYNAVLTAKELGIRIPEDVSIIGFDNSEFCSISPIKLSSINFDKYDFGVKACRLLIDLINGKHPTSNIMVNSIPTLIIRDSCRPL